MTPFCSSFLGACERGAGGKTKTQWCSESQSQIMPFFCSQSFKGSHLAWSENQSSYNGDVTLYDLTPVASWVHLPFPMLPMLEHAGLSWFTLGPSPFRGDALSLDSHTVSLFTSVASLLIHPCLNEAFLTLFM